MFFVCKQETEYGMRISDWSSDVCSSDLAIAAGHEPEFLKRLARSRLARVFCGIHAGIGTADQLVFVVSVARKHCQTEAGADLDLDRIARLAQLQCEWAGQGLRSEEHTSELQSLMRISYAAFRLKKKKKS